MTHFLRRLQRGALVVVSTALIVFAPAIAGAAPIVFDFNSLASGVTNGSINTYMNGILAGVGGSVTVTGAITDKAYTGDGHAVGPNGGSPSLTLGSSDSYAAGTAITTSDLHLTSGDTWIRNNSTTTITMTFTGIKIWQVSFDYQIFPDATCPSGSCGASNVPDFTFKADGNTILHQYGFVPGATTTASGTTPTPGEPAPNAALLHSPVSGSTNNELTPQYISDTAALNGLSGTGFTVTGGFIIFSSQDVLTLQFIDWPVSIGIDNLQLILAPEPSTLLLLALGAGALAFCRKRSR